MNGYLREQLAMQRPTTATKIRNISAIIMIIAMIVFMIFPLPLFVTIAFVAAFVTFVSTIIVAFEPIFKRQIT